MSYVWVLVLSLFLPTTRPDNRATSLRGHLLAPLVKEGMDEADVTRILGRRRLETSALIGGLLFADWHYDRDGVSIEFRPDGQGAFRVVRVTKWADHDAAPDE